MAKKCLKKGCGREPASTHSYCAEHWAEYQREYEKRRIKTSFENGAREGVQACARYLRERLGDRAITGTQAAQLLLRVGAAEETPEQTQRRAMLESLKRRASA